MAAPAKKTPPPAKPSPAIGYFRKSVAGVPVHVVQIDPRRAGVHVTVATSRSGIGGREAWGSLLKRARPAAAITGTYFDTASFVPVGTIVAQGATVHRGGVGTALTISADGKAKLIGPMRGRRHDCEAYQTVMRAGHRLLTSAKATLNARAEGFRDPAIFQLKRRSVVGITSSGKLLFVAIERGVSLRTAAVVLRGLGAVDAMCLDGGGSTALYCRGKTRVKTDRALTNLLVVYDNPQRFMNVAKTLNPLGPKLAEGRKANAG
jgi:exopolysaccharide biosynthesis protein